MGKRKKIEQFPESMLYVLSLNRKWLIYFAFKINRYFILN